MDKELALAKVGLFRSLNPKYMRSVAAACTERIFEPGDYLIRQDESAVGLIVLLSGKVRVERRGSAGESAELAQKGEDSVFGEMAVFDGSPPSVSVVALSPTDCLVLPSWEFNAFLKAHPEAALEILPVVVKRFREKNDLLLSLGSIPAY
ncbi:MAG: Crp/Fnr family transcriptional regulator [Rectinemataceae bacterium]